MSMIAHWRRPFFVLGLLAASTLLAETGELPSWIDLQGEVADAPFGSPTDAVFSADELWAVGRVERNEEDGFALARWRRDPASGLLRFERAFTREDLGLGMISRVHSLAISADARFVYLAGRTFAFESRLAVLARDAGEDRLTLVQVFTNLPDSGNEGKILLPADGRHLYYGSRGIVSCERDALTGLLVRRGTSSSAAVIDLFYDEDRDQLFSTGEEVLHAWQRDKVSGQLTTLGIFDELAVQSGSGALQSVASGRRLARSPDGRWLYVIGFGPALTLDPWTLLVFELQAGVPQLLGYGQGGPTKTSYPSGLAIHPQDGALVLAFSGLPGGAASLAAYPAAEGGRRFGSETSHISLGVQPAQESPIEVLRQTASGELLAGGWDLSHWQRFNLAAGALSLQSTASGVVRLEQPIDLALTEDRQNLLVAVPVAGAIGRLGYRDGILGFDGSSRIAAARLVLLADGRHGVILEPGGSALRLFRLQEGEIRLLGSPLPLDAAKEIAASPDGSRIYAVGAETAVFQFDAAGERLLPDQTLSVNSESRPRISPDGRFLLLNQKFSSIFPFFLSDWLEYDPAAGTYRRFDDLGSLQDELIDVAFAPQGDFAYAFKGSLDPRLVVYPRDPATGALGEPLQEERSEAGAPGIFYFEGQLEIDRSGRFLYLLRQDDEKLIVYERDLRDGRLRHLETFATSDGSAAKVGGLDSGGTLRMVVSSSGNEVFLSSSAQGKVSLLRHHCRVDDARSLCLRDGRFRAEMSLFSPRSGHLAAQRIIAPSPDSGLFEFFSPDNWESLVKVLDGCALNSHYWVYAATASDVDTTLEVTDTFTGGKKSWYQPAGPGRPAITDTLALPFCAATPDPEGVSSAARALQDALPQPSVEPELILGQGRFAVRATWRSSEGEEGAAQVVPFGNDDSGLFSFYDPQNWEVLVKVLNGCALNGRYWVYAASSTDLELHLEVRDLIGLKTRVYTNALGEPAKAITDTSAFECEP